MFLSLEHFYFCHCFVFRASDFEFLTENTGFSVKQYITRLPKDSKIDSSPTSTPGETRWKDLRIDNLQSMKVEGCVP